jgi:hypothetical protein
MMKEPEIVEHIRGHLSHRRSVIRIKKLDVCDLFFGYYNENIMKRW